METHAKLVVVVLAGLAAVGCATPASEHASHHISSSTFTSSSGPDGPGVVSQSAFTSTVTSPDGQVTTTFGSTDMPTVTTTYTLPKTPATLDEPAKASAPVRRSAPATFTVIPVLRRSEVHDNVGQYALGFETGNGIVVEEQGGLRRNLDGEWKDDVVLIKRGSYSYPGPDGRIYTLSYTADENGFHPVADYLPVVPTAAA